MKKIISTLIAVACFLVAVQANAASVRVRCEVRSDRSKVSVDARDVTPGDYRARISSQGNRARAPLTSSIGDEVEFDFDSDPDDIAAGATAIPADFINRSVRAAVIDADGFTVANGRARCEIN